MQVLVPLAQTPVQQSESKSHEVPEVPQLSEQENEVMSQPPVQQSLSMSHDPPLPAQEGVAVVVDPPVPGPP
jgi:hypothetical protein